jgi:RNA polymerase sigma factor (TIGR02999 family)
MEAGLGPSFQQFPTSLQSPRLPDSKLPYLCRIFEFQNRAENGMSSLEDEFEKEQGITAVFDRCLYLRLSSIASKILRREIRHHEWEATDLVHEAFLRLACGRSPVQFRCATHVIALMTVVMRHVLTDRTRGAAIFSRSQRISLDPDWPAPSLSTVKGMAVREALDRLREKHQRISQVVEMHAVYGMGLKEVASHLAISSRTVKRDWKNAQEWLGNELGEATIPSARLRPLRQGKKAVACIGQTLNVESIPTDVRLREVA